MKTKFQTRPMFLIWFGIFFLGLFGILKMLTVFFYLNGLRSFICELSLVWAVFLLTDKFKNFNQKPISVGFLMDPLAGLEFGVFFSPPSNRKSICVQAKQKKCFNFTIPTPKITHSIKLKINKFTKLLQSHVNLYLYIVFFFFMYSKTEKRGWR